MQVACRTLAGLGMHNATYPARNQETRLATRLESRRSRPEAGKQRRVSCAHDRLPRIPSFEGVAERETNVEIKGAAGVVVLVGLRTYCVNSRWATDSVSEARQETAASCNEGSDEISPCIWAPFPPGARRAASSSCSTRLARPSMAYRTGQKTLRSQNGKWRSGMATGCRSSSSDASRLGIQGGLPDIALEGTGRADRVLEKA